MIRKLICLIWGHGLWKIKTEIRPTSNPLIQERHKILIASEVCTRCGKHLGKWWVK